MMFERSFLLLLAVHGSSYKVSFTTEVVLSRAVFEVNKEVFDNIANAGRLEFTLFLALSGSDVDVSVSYFNIMVIPLATSIIKLSSSSRYCLNRIRNVHLFADDEFNDTEDEFHQRFTMQATHGDKLLTFAFVFERCP